MGEYQWKLRNIDIPRNVYITLMESYIELTLLNI